MTSRLFIRLSAISLLALSLFSYADPIHRIAIDGDFSDWDLVPSHTDDSFNTHDTDHDQANDVPSAVEHPDVDLLEFKLTHDETNVYAYFRSRGIIGRTQAEAQGTPGRYYVIVTVDVDNDDVTGYPIHEGGYYPTSDGYDMNFEVEFYNGTFNTGHYLNHGCLDEAGLAQAFEDQAQGIVRVLPGTYDFYSQWVYFDTVQGIQDEIILPNGDSVIWVKDKGPVYQGIIEIALSQDGHEAEVIAPFRGFMNDPDGNPIVALGKTLDASFSLEASSELAPGGQWASNTGLPIEGYVLERAESDFDDDGFVDSFEEHHGTSPTDFDDKPASTGVEGDIDLSNVVDAIDVQLVINGALGIPTPAPTDVNNDNDTNATDVQVVINAALAR